MIEKEEELHPLRQLALQDMSYSRISTYEWCQLKYYYHYIMQYPEEYGSPALLGNIIHKALEVSIVDGEEINKSELLSNYRAAIEDFDPEHTIPSTMIQDGETMLLEYADANPGPQSVYAQELPFSFVVGNARVNGFMDHVSVSDTSVNITDYKCVEPTTKIQMADGSQKEARFVEVGDMVVAYGDGVFVPAKVIDKFDNGMQLGRTITTDNGRILNCTNNHPILTPNGWVEARHIKPGKHQVRNNIDSKHSKDCLFDNVVDVQPWGERRPTIGLTIEGYHTHITDGIVSHNSGKSKITWAQTPTNMQLGIYSLYLRELFPDKEIHAELYYLRDSNNRYHTYTSEELDQMEDLVAAKTQEILNKETFHPTPNTRNCRWCSYAADGTCAVGASRMSKSW